MKKNQDDESDKMLPFAFDLQESDLIYIDTTDQLYLLYNSFKDCILMGIDTETKPYKGKRKSYNEKVHPTSIIQIATRSSALIEKVFIVDLLSLSQKEINMEKLDDIFHDIFDNDSCLKIGQGLRNDFEELACSYPRVSAFKKIKGVVDTSELIKLLDPDILHMPSLKNLVKTYLHFNLIKTQQVSDWGQRPLNSKQIDYAACDALVLLRLYDAMLCEIEELYSKTGSKFDIYKSSKFLDLSIPLPLSNNKRKKMNKVHSFTSSNYIDSSVSQILELSPNVTATVIIPIKKIEPTHIYFDPSFYENYI